HAELNDPANRRIGSGTAGEERVVEIAVVELVRAAAVHAVARYGQPRSDLTLKAETDALRLRRLRIRRDDGLARRDGAERAARERIRIAGVLDHDRVGILRSRDVELHVEERSIDVQPPAAA